MASTDAASAEMMFDPPVSRLSTLRYARKFGLVLVLLAIVFGVVSFLILLGLTPIEPTFPVIVTTMVVNGVFVTALLLLVGREVMTLLEARRRGRAAARMHIRIVGLFGIVAAFPAILVAIIAGITLDLGLDRIFDQRSRTIIDNSVSVAQSYLGEAMQELQGQTLAMSNSLSRNGQQFALDRSGFVLFMSSQARVYGLRGAFVLNKDGEQIVVSNIPGSEELPRAPADLLVQAAAGRGSCLAPNTTNFAACLVPVRNLDGAAYLWTLKWVNPSVLNSIQLMREITSEYQSLESGRLPLQIAFALLYVGICLTVLLSAIWMGIAVADRLVAPIRQLIAAADEVRAGNLEGQVSTVRTEGELRSLTDTFNAMTLNLRSQRDEILANQEQTDRRRRFTEAVLSGVTAGVIGVSPEGRLAITNSSAEALIAHDGDESLIGRPLREISPALADVVDKAQQSGRPSYLEQITLAHDGRERILNVQVAVESSDEQSQSHVITIDDITDLVSAQRTSAWADVARRIAHEIKNPLTPIQLSAERIRRRYGKKITEDREVFDQCTETIIRQVADIGRMVDEFSSFARMPKPSMKQGNLVETLREAIFLLKVSNEEIDFQVELPDKPAKAQFDSRLLGQAFGNLIKNATEAMEDVEFEKGERPTITIRLLPGELNHTVEIIDNGKGLPQENRQRLLEPYMTTREKGTGLGLAIVGKILEEHNATIELRDAPQVADGGRGAMVRVVIPAIIASASESDSEEDQTAAENV
ncbi:ATP-binding protein [Pseudahrensia aquimaris]|uniref:histidine kinase n=1 Tax=Pseudahrensia aquimaris TaxID=744461 RepID=A0ABW3FD78_9HYPH